MASVSRGNLSSKQRLPRPMSTQCLTRLDTWRTALPSGQDVNMCWNSVGILLVILIGDSHISIHFPGISMDFRRFPGASQRLAMLSFRTGRTSNKGHCSLNSTETVRSKLCEFTNLYEL